MKKEQFEKTITYEIALITALIRHPAGYAVDLFGDLMCIRPTDQLTFEVEWDIRCIDGNENLESKIDYLSFSTAEEAAKCFVEKRHEFRLGVDFEWEDYREFNQLRNDGKIKDLFGIVKRKDSK